jgi:saccharopine dehydrogenase-like NADP-dependent oxidoreductase
MKAVLALAASSLTAGKIGATIAEMIAGAGDYRVTVADHSAAQLGALNSRSTIEKAQLDIESNALNYNLTWSTDGVINEYCEPLCACRKGFPRGCTR